MKPACHKLLAAVVFVVSTSMGGAAYAQPQSVPCIDIGNGAVQAVSVVPDSRGWEGQSVVIDSLKSLNAAARTIGATTRGSNKVETITIRKILLAYIPPNMAAQEVQPTVTDDGTLSATYDASQVHLEQATITFPNCVRSKGDEKFIFDGSIVLNNGKVVFDGRMKKLQPPVRGGRGDPTPPKRG